MSNEPTDQMEEPKPEGTNQPPRRRPPQRRRPPKRTVKDGEEERNVLLDEDHTPPVSNLTGREDEGTNQKAEPTAEVVPAGAGLGTEVAQGRPRDLVSVLVNMLPEPHPRHSQGDTLLPSEREEYGLCNEVLDLADSMWWAVGKAAEVVRDGDQYIEEYGTWEDFCKIRMEKTARSVDMTISLWGLGTHLNSTVGEPRDLTVKEDWARKLKPYADAHGFDAAAFVLAQLAQALADGRVAKITGPLIESALQRLPPGRYNEDEVMQILAAFPAGVIVADVPDPRASDPAEFVTRQFAAIGGAARRIMKAAHSNPATAARVADQLQELVDELRKIQ